MRHQNLLTRWVIPIMAVVILANPVLAQQGTETPDTKNAEQEKLVAKLERYLTGTRWVGQFTITGKDLGDLTPEYYEITKAKKVDQGDLWLLTVRIKYGDHDTSLDMPPIEVKWAGGTPVITVDQVTVPGLGTFDARVVIRKNKYAGTWSHNEVGGHLFGKIERLDEKQKPKQEANSTSKSASSSK